MPSSLVISIFCVIFNFILFILSDSALISCCCTSLHSDHLSVISHQVNGNAVLSGVAFEPINPPIQAQRSKVIKRGSVSPL